MVHVVPAIIPETLSDVEFRMRQVRNFVPYVQVDIIDGVFAPDPTWPYVNDDGTFQKIVDQVEEMPHWKDVGFEVDLMVQDPEQVIDQWIDAGAQGIILHVESDGDMSVIIDHIIERSGASDTPLHTNIGLALVPSTPIEALVPYMDRADFVQCMGSDEIGFHGVELEESVYDKIRSIRVAHPEHDIAVDIGVNTETAPKLVEAGCTKLVSGSAIYDADNIGDQIKTFQKL